MKKILLLFIITVVLSGCEVERPKPEINPAKLNWGMESNIAFSKSQEIYNEAVKQGLDLSSGPCLSNSLHGNQDYPETMWVLDIAHNPRQDIDNLPENQCSAFKEGRAVNFIELDENGNVIAIFSPYFDE